MWKILPVIAIAISGCSNITINATMCEQIASDPRATVPQECQKYSKERAEKAFNKTKIRHESQENIIKFSKDADDKQD